MFTLEAWLSCEVEEVEFGLVGKLLLLYLPFGICLRCAQTLKDVVNRKLVYKIVWFLNKHRPKGLASSIMVCSNASRTPCLGQPVQTNAPMLVASFCHYCLCKPAYKT